MIMVQRRRGISLASSSSSSSSSRRRNMILSFSRVLVIAALTNCMLTGHVFGGNTSNNGDSGGIITFAEARVWQTIVDHNIVRRSTTESLRYSLVIEADPFFFPGDEDLAEGDGMVSHAQNGNANGWVTLAPTLAPSMVPSDAPSLSPTAWDIDRNGGCRQGMELFEVHMYDSWGDGWDESTYVTISGISDQDPNIQLPSSASMQRTITKENQFSKVKIFRTIDLQGEKNVFQPTSKTEIDPLGTPIFIGNLKRGSHEVGQVCLLPKRCYQVTVNGGDFLDEVSWDIRKVDLEARYGDNAENATATAEELLPPALGGGAPMNCTMSLPDEYGHHFCANECSPIEVKDDGGALPEVKESSILQYLEPAGVTQSNQHTSSEVANSFGTTRTQPANNQKWTGIRGDGFGLGSFSVLRNFKQPQVEEDETGDS